MTSRMSMGTSGDSPHPSPTKMVPTALGVPHTGLTQLCSSGVLIPLGVQPSLGSTPHFTPCQPEYLGAATLCHPTPRRTHIIAASSPVGSSALTGISWTSPSWSPAQQHLHYQDTSLAQSIALHLAPERPFATGQLRPHRPSYRDARPRAHFMLYN